MIAKILSYFILIVLLSCVKKANTSQTQSIDSLLTDNSLSYGCPKFLVRENILNYTQEYRSTLGLEVGLKENCTALDDKAFPTSDSLEYYLSRNAHTSLNTPDFSVTQCIQKYLDNNPGRIGPHFSLKHLNFGYQAPAQTYRDLISADKVNINRRIIADYYFYMNSMKQTVRGLLEIIAAFDLIQGKRPFADANDGEHIYFDSFIPDSWKTFKSLLKCSVDTSAFDQAVKTTKHALAVLTVNRWKSAKLREALKNTGSNQLNPDKINQELANLDQSKSLILASTPWLVCENCYYMVRYKDWRLVSGNASFDVTDQSVLASAAHWLDDDENKPDGLRQKLLAQFGASRERVYRFLKKYFVGARCLHSENSACSDYLNALLQDTPPFDAESVTSEWSADKEVILRDLVATARTETQRATFENLKSKLGTASVEVLMKQAATPTEALALKGLQTKLEGVQAASSLSSAQCRRDVRAANSRRTEAAYEIGMLVATPVFVKFLEGARIASLTSLAAARERAQAEALLTNSVEAGTAAVLQSAETRAIFYTGANAVFDLYYFATGIHSSVVDCMAAYGDLITDFYKGPLNPDSQACLDGSPIVSANNLPNNAIALHAQASQSTAQCLLSVAFNMTLGVIPAAITVPSYFKQYARALPKSAP